MPDDDSPTPPAPELRPAARRRPTAERGSDEQLAVLEEAAATAAAAEAQSVTAEAQADAATSSLDLGAALPEVASPPPPASDASWAGLTAEARSLEQPQDSETADAADPAPADPAEPAAGPLAPAKKAAKKAPAKKAVATKAPAKKAVAAKAPAKKAAAKKSAAKKAPAKKAVAGTADNAVLAAAAAAVAGAELSAAAMPPLAPVAEPEAHVEPAATREKEVSFHGPATVLPSERGLPAGARLLVTLTVLLLAAAVGMGAAALVEHGQETWRSTLTVRFVPGIAASGDLSAQISKAQQAYADQVPGLTSEVARTTGVPVGDVRHALSAKPLGKDQIEVSAEAARGPQAEAMVIRASYAVMTRVPKDQVATVASPAERVNALVSGYATRPERTRPDDRLALVVGIAAGLAVLMLAGTLALIARGRD